MNIIIVVSSVDIRIGMENNRICQCGHTRKQHTPESEHVESTPCYACLDLYIKDHQNKISLENAHKMCSDFIPDNLRYLEQEYERLSKRI